MTKISSASGLIASAFTRSRLEASGLSDYPGQVPQSLGDAYAIQDAAIDLWPEEVAGWKIGGIGGDFAKTLGQTKLAGPVFGNQIFKSDRDVVEMKVFEDGFAAVEPEIVIIVAKDAPEDKVDWTDEEALNYVGDIHIGVEIASSPFPAINDMGPLVTISDFGNNNGLIIGQKLVNWDWSKLEDWQVETIIEGESLGVRPPPGPLESFRFVLGNTASRNRPLKKGMAITTGAITGVHQAFVGQSSTINCTGVRPISILLVPET